MPATRRGAGAAKLWIVYEQMRPSVPMFVDLLINMFHPSLELRVQPRCLRLEGVLRENRRDTHTRWGPRDTLKGRISWDAPHRTATRRSAACSEALPPCSY